MISGRRQRGRAAAGGKEKADLGARQGDGGPEVHHPAQEGKAEVYVLSKEEGGRDTPFFNGYRPQFYFRTTDVTGHLQLPQGVEMIMPGDNINVTIDLHCADRHGEDPEVRHPRRWPHHRLRTASPRSCRMKRPLPGKWEMDKLEIGATKGNEETRKIHGFRGSEILYVYRFGT